MRVELRACLGRPSVLGLVAILVLGCSGPMPAVCTPGESRACTCSSGAAGAQSCALDGSHLEACVCAMADGGAVPLDGGLEEGDAGELVRDAGRDAGVDGGSDAGPADGGPPPDAGPPEGECWLVPQAGCEDGEACRRSRGEVSTFPRSGPPMCEDEGPLMEWQPTSEGCRVDGQDRCRAGLFCMSFGQCARYCDPAGEPCPLHPDGVTVQRCHTLAIGVSYCEWRSI